MTPADALKLEELLDSANAPLGPTLERVRLLVEDYNRLIAGQQARDRFTDLDHLLLALYDDRDVLLMAIGDAMLEAGREAEAKGWLWLGMNKKWPTRSKEGWWWFEANPPSVQTESDRLPRKLRLAMGYDPEITQPLETKRFCYPTARAALEAVVDAIATGAWSVDKEKA